MHDWSHLSCIGLFIAKMNFQPYIDTALIRCDSHIPHKLPGCDYDI